MNGDRSNSAPRRASPGGAWAGPRLLPPVLIVVVGLALRFVPGSIAPLTPAHFAAITFAGLGTLLTLLIWWLFVRGVPLRQRLVGLAIVVGLIVVTFALSDTSMPWFLVPYGIPAMLAVTVATLACSTGLRWPVRRWVVVGAVAASMLPWIALRHDGQAGDLRPELALRGSETGEDRFLAGRIDTDRDTVPVRLLAQARSDWPGFRGPARDGKVRGLTFNRDWSSSPPRELWRRPVGPAWSSFAVAGPLAFTQEQRGTAETVVAYSIEDGREVWNRSTAERFEEPAAGPGPRATPTFDGDALFTLGASGTLQRLDAATGARRWRRDLREDLGARIPDWGFSSSPAIVGRSVVVFAGAPEGHAVAAYDRETGALLWTGGEGSLSYGSGHVVSLDGTPLVMMASDFGLQAFEPATGAVVLEHRWPTPEMPRVVQPVILDGGTSLLLGTGYGLGTRRLAIERSAGRAWSVRETWTSRALKPYFNDMVCHSGHCYGFDGKIFTCIGLDDGVRRWKGGRYGNGQVLLIADMDLLLVVTERGEVVLVEASPDAHREVARLPALSGKTWNHPTVTGGKLLMRNDEEAVCYELPGATVTRS